MKINKSFEKALRVADQRGFVVRSIYYEQPNIIIETVTCKLVIAVNHKKAHLVKMFYKY